ncbi:MAG TPA: histidine--tRNA ligase [Thermoanaerobaculia bacterium]|nr:histidine--tRNA ligase [Thermoanaerobaculia bacterium]
MTKHSALPGFRDFYPEEMVRRQQIFEAWHQVVKRFGFELYDGPPLEGLELYVEKSGPEIVNQLFNFTDKGGREVALRPEMTPTLVRMVGARIKGMARPVRWASMPQLFRYEKQQRGRLREHFQLNMDIIGEESVLADADLLAAALDVLRILGLQPTDVVARVSDRRLLQAALLEEGLAEADLPVAYNVIDKIEREPRETLAERLTQLGLDRAKADRILGLTTLSLDDLRAQYGGNERIAPVLDRLDDYFRALADLGFADWVAFDMKIVRGLAYYTGIVFEIFDRKGELRAICGGGRYDNLFASLADVDVPALGFGFGDVVLGELLKDRKLARERVAAVDAAVVPVNDSVRSDALRIVSRLRGEGLSVTYPYKSAGVGKALKAAAAGGVREAIVVGPDEVAAGIVSVRNLTSGEERKVSLEDYLDGLRERKAREVWE